MYSFIFKIDINIINMTTINLNRKFIISDLNKINKEFDDIINIENKLEIKKDTANLICNDEKLEIKKNIRVGYNCEVIKNYISRK